MRLLFLPLLLVGLAACALHPSGSPDAAAPRASQELQTTFIVVRHAEKASDHPDDPALDADGQARAVALAQALAEVPVSAVYATPTRRTRQTAAPLAAEKALEVRDYDPALAA